MQRERILVVDDSATDAVLLKLSLEHVGYEVIRASDGDQAVAIARQQRPDLILLDILMPGQDGLSVCRTLQKQDDTCSIPVIFVTGQTESRDIIRAFAVGCCDYVTKPFVIDEVLARVSTHLQLRQAQRALLEQNAKLADLAKELCEANTELAQLTRLDPLTQLLNRSAWQESVLLEHERSERQGHIYSMVMLDVDHFKLFNDTQGHQAGDDCLRRIADCIRSACRSIDPVGRYGGEEFVVLAPETNLLGARKLGERVRKAVWNLGVSHPHSGVGPRVTVSVGVASGPEGSWEKLLKRADEALYMAKKAGRNMVYAHPATPRSPEVPARSASFVASPGPAPAVAKRAVSVLVIGNGDRDRRLCRACLEQEGHEVHEADGHGDVQAAVSTTEPDVIIMDVGTPEAPMLDAVRRLKRDPDTRDIPVIVLSGRTGTTGIQASLEAGADEHLTKPIAGPELVLRVRCMTRLCRERRDLLASYQWRGEQSRLLTLLLDYCRTMGSLDSLDQVLERTIRVAEEVSGCRRISIMLPDTDRRFLSIAKSIGIDQDIAATVRVPAGGAIAGRVFQSGQPIVVNSEEEATFCERAYDVPFFTSLPLTSAALGTSDHLVGVLNVTERFDGRPFEPQELEYIDLIASIAGAAIHGIHSRQARDQARDSIVIALARLAEHRDNDTGRHLDRVARYCLILARELRAQDPYREQIDDAFVHDLVRAVPLHDIGKVAIPDHILLKPGKLTPDEMAIMCTHSQIGADIIRSVMNETPGVAFLKMAEEIAHAHHEWHDGSGYPRGLQDEQIPLSARIAALADVYDALTTQRPYKAPFTHDKAIEIISQNAGRQFDPGIVDAFLTHEQEFARLVAELSDDPGAPQHAALALCPDKHELVSAG